MNNKSGDGTGSFKVYKLYNTLLKTLEYFYKNKMLSYRRETALQGTLVLAESGRLELRDNILLIL